MNNIGNNPQKLNDIAGQNDTGSEASDLAEGEGNQRSFWEIVGGEASSALRQGWVAIKVVLILTTLCGVVFPALIFAVGQLAFNKQANGSLVTNAQGIIIGSELIGQQFNKPEYFHGRPSVTGYNAASSSGSNIGPTNPQLIDGNGSTVAVAAGDTPPANSTPVAGKPNSYFVPGTYAGVKSYAARFLSENSLPIDTELPADIVSASGSGLDPDISVQAAMLQVNRIAAARSASATGSPVISAGALNDLIAKHTEQRQLGVIGEPVVNVLLLNMDLDSTFGTLTGAK